MTGSMSVLVGKLNGVLGPTLVSTYELLLLIWSSQSPSITWGDPPLSSVLTWIRIDFFPSTDYLRSDATL